MVVETKLFFFFFFFFFFCRDKHKTFVAINTCRNKNNFAATKVLSRQAYFCGDKTFVAKCFVATKVCLSLESICRYKTFHRDKIMFVATNVLSRRNIFVATKMVLMAAPATDIY